MTNFHQMRDIMLDLRAMDRRERNERRYSWFKLFGNVLLAFAVGLWIASWAISATAARCVNDPAWCQEVAK